VHLAIVVASFLGASLLGDGLVVSGVPAARPAAAAPKRPAKPPAKPPVKAPARPVPGRAAAPAPPPAPRDERIEIEIVRERLAGGVEVVVAPMPASPVLGVALLEGAGSSSDPAGRGGLTAVWSHLGGRAASPQRRSQLVADRGGRCDLRIGRDDVISTYVLPAGELELALWLEADRLAPRVEEATLVDALRAIAERHARDPFARHEERVDALAFQGFAPYAHATDGTPEELLAIREDALSGAITARPPRPLVLVIAGPVEPAAALALARHHLGPARAGVAAAPPGELPDQINQRAIAVVDAQTRTSALLLGFAVARPAVATDGPALELAAAVLAGGPRSRLARTVIDDGSASSARAWLERRSGPSMFRVEVRMAPGADPVTVRERVERATQELGKAAPRPDELQRARAWLALDESRTMGDADDVAVRLGRDVLAGAPQIGRWDLGRWRDVDGEAVARAATTHLTPIRRNVLEVQPERPLEAPPAATPRSAPAAAPKGRAPARPPRGGAKPAKKKGSR
jgi:zinc protease